MEPMFHAFIVLLNGDKHNFRITQSQKLALSAENFDSGKCWSGSVEGVEFVIPFRAIAYMKFTAV